MKGTIEFAKLLYYGRVFLWERQDPDTADAVLVFETALQTLNDIEYTQDGSLRVDILAIFALVWK